ncbi:major facilitator superfamily domain-containing protein [Hirsutella rhossiliensis]|uniref:Major facilitator superfamily domain-containing protein n=1 Tax=Hirsutella rhossiliensis TaxID=111463 RepID=A0A9P8N5T1_9HYPO|nr:major facilitator superfamily domain-containing protein [Hirsutella rhossiliensis]KAH0966299.1 major facilitator superfamily domain-containing protein [Hirsutella rhossiliensis]
MECDTFYDASPPYGGDGDRCSIAEIAARTATQFSIFNMSTTLCGILNLFVARWQVQRFGPRAALVAQIFVPAIRVAAQIPGVLTGKRTGIAILQASQVITIFGGPAGYFFVINIIAGGVVEPARRTAIFGKLQGCIMLGEGIGFLAGGMAGNAFDIRAPFIIAFTSFLLAGVYARAAIPYMAPDSVPVESRPSQGGVSTIFAPLKIVLPQRLRLVDGRVTKHYGVMFLCGGFFLGVLATGYAPSLIQMYAAADFDFNQADNGWLTSEFAFMRGLVLIFIFPRIVTWGRRWFSSATPTPERFDESGEASAALLPSSPGRWDADAEGWAREELVRLDTCDQGRRSRLFDLVFLRWSLVVDGALTTMAAFSTRRWHVYLAALVLPFGSGSAPTAKGIISDMCSESQRDDALHTITLVEQVAKLAAQGLFGFVFASLAEERKAYGTFFCNAAVAVTAMAVLLLSSFPPANSTLIDETAYGEDLAVSEIRTWRAKTSVQEADR